VTHAAALQARLHVGVPLIFLPKPARSFYQALSLCVSLTFAHREIFNKYKQLVVTSYKEPDRNGLFDHYTKNILKELPQEDHFDS